MTGSQREDGERGGGGGGGGGRLIEGQRKYGLPLSPSLLPNACHLG